MRLNWIWALLISGGVCLAVSGYAAKQKASTVTAASDLKWAPMSKDQPDGPQMAVIRGEPKKGPIEFIGKFPAGMKAPPHWHTADYHAVLIQGTWVHSEPGKEGSPLEPGSYWFQPGKAVHTDECRSITACLVYIDVHGPFDFHPVVETKVQVDHRAPETQ